MGSSTRELAQAALDALVDGTDPTNAEFTALTDEIAAYVRAAWPRVSPADLSDAVAETVTRLWSNRARLKNVAPASRLGYAMRVARNLQIDRFRRAREVVDAHIDERLEDEAMEDADIIRLIEQDATMSEVQATLRALYEEGDHQCVRIVTRIAELASEAATPPSDRRIGLDLGVHHQTVSRARDRFRTRLDQLREEWK